MTMSSQTSPLPPTSSTLDLSTPLTPAAFQSDTLGLCSSTDFPASFTFSPPSIQQWDDGLQAYIQQQPDSRTTSLAYGVSTSGKSSMYSSDGRQSPMTDCLTLHYHTSPQDYQTQAQYMNRARAHSNPTIPADYQSPKFAMPSSKGMDPTWESFGQSIVPQSPHAVSELGIAYSQQGGYDYPVTQSSLTGQQQVQRHAQYRQNGMLQAQNLQHRALVGSFAGKSWGV